MCDAAQRRFAAGNGLLQSFIAAESAPYWFLPQAKAGEINTGINAKAKPVAPVLWG